MGKNINIQEGGIGKQMTVDKLKTNLVGGGTCLWVPEEDVRLGTKYISENGTYRASDDGLYGYSEVTVSGVGSVTGIDPETGEETTVTVDPETEELVETVVPTEIRVIEPPTNPYGIYVDGQTITKDGIVVKAYSANGVEMQTVPIGEITISPTTAVYDQSTDTGGYDEATIDTSVLYYPDAITQPVTAISQIVETTNNPKQTITYTPYGSSYLFLLEDERITVPMAIITANGSGYREKCVNESDPRQSYDVTRTANLSNNTRVSHTPFGYIEGASADKSYSGRVRTGVTTKISDFTYIENELYRDLATIILDGSVTHTRAGSRQTITVSWPRPGDGKVLETSFEILVAPPYSDGIEE